MPNLEPLAAAAFAVFVLVLTVALGVGAPWLNLSRRSRKRGFPVTRRREARRKKA